MPYLLHMMVYHKVKQPPGLLAQRQYFSFEFLNSSLKGMKQKQSEDTAVLDMSIQLKYLRDNLILFQLNIPAGTMISIESNLESRFYQVVLRSVSTAISSSGNWVKI